MSSLHIYSEIGKLKKVLLHEPGEELNNLTPNSLEELLFDDIPWLPLAKKEHQAFANAFKENGIEVVYLVDLAAEVLKDKNVKKEFIETFLEDLGPTPNILKAHISTFLNSIKDEKELVKCHNKKRWEYYALKEGQGKIYQKIRGYGILLNDSLNE